MRHRTVVAMLAAVLLHSTALANDLPANANPNLQYFGYYFADGRGGNFTSEVWPYTNTYLALPGGYDTALNWQPLLRESLNRAVQNNKRIWLQMKEDSGYNPPLNWDNILSVADEFWPNINQVEVLHEPNLSASQTESEINRLKEKLRLLGLDQNKPFGITQAACAADNACAGSDAKNAPSLSWVGIEAYVDPGQTGADLNALLDRAKNNVPAGKQIILVMMACDRAGQFTDIRTLKQFQKPVYLKSYNDSRVIAIQMFNYGRQASNEGGTRFHPELKIAHYQIAERLFGALPAPQPNYRSFFAEGAQNSFFRCAFSLTNPNASAATALVRFRRTDGHVATQYTLLPAWSRTTIYPEDIGGFNGAEFAAEVESDIRVVADRLMEWNSTLYGSHLETGTAAASTSWYVTEGTTVSGFDLYYLLQNSNSSTATVDITYLRPSGSPPITVRYSVAANSRLTIWVNGVSGIGQTDVSGKIISDIPIVFERAMYYTSGTTFRAGIDSLGVTAPSTSWFFAEGATGPFFDLYLLLGNPNSSTATIRATYLLPSGSTVTRDYSVSPNSRITIWVDGEPGLADTNVSVKLDSLNGVTFITDRTMWWSGSYPNWYEAHVGAGATSTGTRWVTAGGELGGSQAIETYILLANTSTSSGTATVTHLRQFEK